MRVGKIEIKHNLNESEISRKLFYKKFVAAKIFLRKSLLVVLKEKKREGTFF